MLPLLEELVAAGLAGLRSSASAASCSFKIASMASILLVVSFSTLILAEVFAAPPCPPPKSGSIRLGSCSVSRLLIEGLAAAELAGSRGSITISSCSFEIVLMASILPGVSPSIMSLDVVFAVPPTPSPKSGSSFPRWCSISRLVIEGLVAAKPAGMRRSATMASCSFKMALMAWILLVVSFSE